MARKIPHNFLESGEASIASYDFIDIAEGRGVVVFNAGEASDSNFLSSNEFYSQEVARDVNATSANSTQMLDIDYDATFRMPQRIEGNALLNVTIGTQKLTNTGIVEMFVRARVRKWDGTPGAGETEIATNDSNLFNTGSIVATTIASRIECIDITIPKTHYKAGETLRLTIELWAKTSTASAQVGFGQDPKDRNDDDTPQVINDTETTKLEFHVPFILDL